MEVFAAVHTVWCLVLAYGEVTMVVQWEGLAAAVDSETAILVLLALAGSLGSAAGWGSPSDLSIVSRFLLALAGALAAGPTYLQMRRR